MTKETYYVTQEQLDLITELKSLPAPLVAIMNKRYGIETLYNELSLSDKECLRYLGGDTSIEFKVKEQFVEKEKKYVWRLKNNNLYVLTNHGGSTQVNIVTTSESSLTESEIREWGYNPEMFNKEEV